MNTLIIKAHPAAYGFTHKIADAYADAVQHKDSTVEVIDLYNDPQYQQPFLTFQDAKGDWSGQQARELIQSKISWADELVFVYPTWWMGMPAVMKNFFDNNFTSGFAYQFKNGKMEGLLNGKTAKLFTTGDGPTMMYAFVKPMLSIILHKGVFGFCGMKMGCLEIFTDMTGHRNDAARDAMLEIVRARVSA